MAYPEISGGKDNDVGGFESDVGIGSKLQWDREGVIGKKEGCEVRVQAPKLARPIPSPPRADINPQTLNSLTVTLP